MGKYRENDVRPLLLTFPGHALLIAVVEGEAGSRKIEDGGVSGSRVQRVVWSVSESQTGIAIRAEHHLRKRFAGAPQGHRGLMAEFKGLVLARSAEMSVGVRPGSNVADCYLTRAAAGCIFGCILDPEQAQIPRLGTVFSAVTT